MQKADSICAAGLVLIANKKMRIYSSASISLGGKASCICSLDSYYLRLRKLLHCINLKKLTVENQTTSLFGLESRETGLYININLR